MKKYLTVALTLLVLVFAGCGADRSDPAAQGFTLAIEADSADEIYAVGQNFELAGEALGSSVMTNADGTAIRDTIYFFIQPEDLPEGAVLDKFSFTLTLYPTLADDPLAPTAVTNEAAAFHPSWGETYHYTVSGDFNSGFTLKKDAD